MEKVELVPGLKVSKVIHGYWRLNQWNISTSELVSLMGKLIDIGVDTFDNADIYGDYECEEIFGRAVAMQPQFRSRMKLITKCGIMLTSAKFPQRELKHYDYSIKHIVTSVNRSLKNFRTDYIDLLLLHRPSPMLNPIEVAEAFNLLKSQGKVNFFGVSNFNAVQFEMLQSYLDFPLATNQIEISPYNLEHFDNGNLDYLIKQRVKPMAWSPLGGGQILKPTDPKGERILKALQKVSLELGFSNVETAVYAWLFSHPAGIVPIVGSGKFNRVKLAVEAVDYKLTSEQWFRIYSASKGEDVP
ncbi:MAG TPA: aldo/keto reductase [Tenuifilaceae bacterium]|nr:aldo/keto reductase [Tenuifilaceae bacterium]